MVATLREAFGNYNYNGNDEQQMIESYCRFINMNVQFSSFVSSKKQKCINNNKKPILIPPWYITNSLVIVFTLPPVGPQNPIQSVLPTYEVNAYTGHYNTEICGSLKGFTFKAFKLLVETINKYNNDPSAEFFAPNNYIDLEQGWHVVRWKPPPPQPPPCSVVGGPCGGAVEGRHCCTGLTCEGGFYGTCEKK